MDPVSIAFGVAAVVYGVVTAVLRVIRPSAFSKLEPMKQRWGDRAGLAIHVAGYTVVPILFGLVSIAAGIARGSIVSGP